MLVLYAILLPLAESQLCRVVICKQHRWRGTLILSLTLQPTKPGSPRMAKGYRYH